MSKLRMIILIVCGFLCASFNYNDPEHHFTLEFPEGWKVNGEDPSSAMSASVDGASMNVIVIDLKEEERDIPLPYLLTIYLDRVHDAVPNYELLEVERLDLHGVVAYRLLCTFSLGPTDFKGVVFLTKTDDKVYEVSLVVPVDTFEDFRSQLEAIGESLRVR